MNIATDYFHTAASHLNQVPLDPQAVPELTDNGLSSKYQLITLVALSAIAMTPYKTFANIALCATFIPSLFNVALSAMLVPSCYDDGGQNQRVILNALSTVTSTALRFFYPLSTQYYILLSNAIGDLYNLLSMAVNAATLQENVEPSKDNTALDPSIDQNPSRVLTRFAVTLASLSGNVALLATFYFGGPQVIAAALILKGASEIFKGARIVYYNSSYTDKMAGVMFVALGAFRAYSGSAILQNAFVANQSITGAFRKSA